MNGPSKLRQTAELVFGYIIVAATLLVLWSSCDPLLVPAAQPVPPAKPPVARVASDEPLRIEGPEAAKVGQAVRLSLVGAPALDVNQPLGDQLVWAQSMHIRLLSAHEGAALDSGLAIVFPLALQVRMEFVADKPGVYWVVLDWNYRTPQLLVHRITVDGPAPTPDPTPGPTPPPGPKYAVIVEESSRRTPKDASIILSKSLRTWADERGHVIRVLDKDAAVPQDLRPYLDVVGARSLPRIVIATTSGKILVNEPLPDSIDAIKQLLGEAK